MMKTIELEKEEIYCGNLLLVNKNYPLRDNNVKGLVPADVRFPNILMKRDVANVLQLIFEKISAGNSIVPVSGYRSLEEQTAIYDGSLKDNGEDFTRKYVALPNHSEHQTGLAIDLGLNEKEIDFIRPDFPYVGICNEFKKARPRLWIYRTLCKGQRRNHGNFTRAVAFSICRIPTLKKLCRKMVFHLKNTHNL